MLLHSLKKYSLPSIGQEGDKISLLHNEDELNALFLSYVDRQKAPMALVREVYPQEVKKIEDAMATKKSQKKTASHEKTTKDVVIDGLIHLPYVMCKLCNPDNDARIIAKVGRS